jgi:hypothetical protein
VVASRKTFNYSSSSAQTFSDWGAGTGTINLSGSGTVTLSGGSKLYRYIKCKSDVSNVNGTRTETGLGKATTIDIKNGGTIKVQQGDNATIS